MKRLTVVVFICLMCLAAGFAEDKTEPGDSLKELEKYNAASENAIETTGFWEIVREMESLGNQILPFVENGLKSQNANIRLACARVLYNLDRKPEGISVFLSVLQSEGGNKTGLIAIELLSNLIRFSRPDDSTQKELVNMLHDKIEETVNIYQRLSLSKLLYQVSGEAQAVKNIKEILEQKDPNLKLAAAFALADMDQFEKSKDILKKFSVDPTETGRLARLFLEYKELQEYYQRQDAQRTSSDSNYKLLDEIITLIKSRYVDQNKSNNDKALMEAAAAGMVASLDRFSGYQDAEERKKARESLNMRYGGIGAYVNIRDDYLTIERPMYGWPAYQAGLRSLDRITEIEGESTKSKEMTYLVNKLKGAPGTQVKIKVFRRGWTKERDFVLTRAIVNVKTARAEMLPGQIGYLSLITFGDNTAEETKDCLKNLSKQGMKSLIVDVRKNSGGYLKAVLEILELALDKGLILVTTRDRNSQIDEYKSQYSDKIDLPIYVLVDEYSASASEILAGVLQDHHKALLVGNTTFGKGSVQHIFELKSLNPHPALRLTIALYYLPSGRSIHKVNGVGGLEPDINVTEQELDLAKEYEFNKLLDSGQLDNYLGDNYPTDSKLFQSLAYDDGLDCNRYPKFDELYQNLKTRLEKDEVRQALRQHIRRRVADERGQEFLIDLQNDSILQRAIIEAAKKLNIDPATLLPYKPFADKFNK